MEKIYIVKDWITSKEYLFNNYKTANEFFIWLIDTTKKECNINSTSNKICFEEDDIQLKEYPIFTSIGQGIKACYNENYDK